MSGTGMEVVPNLPSVGYEGYGCYTKLTKVSGIVRLLVPVPVPDPLYFNKAVPGTRLFCRGCTELTKVSGTGMDVVPNLPKCRVRVWMFYQAYQRVGYGTISCTYTRTRPRVFQQDRIPYQGNLPLAYRTCQSVGFGFGSRIKLTEVSGTGNTRGTPGIRSTHITLHTLK